MVFDLQMYTLIHVVISVLGIISGLLVIGGMMSGARMDLWTALFLLTTILTNVTAFGFPFRQVLPAHIVAAISLVVLAVCVLARYVKKMEGIWGPVYVASAVAAVYFNVFVLVVQLFAKTPPLKELAPTQAEAPFAVTQLLILAMFVWLGLAALRGFRPKAVSE
jgi:magnesium-transporting ATPase (P-type)